MLTIRVIFVFILIFSFLTCFCQSEIERPPSKVYYKITTLGESIPSDEMSKITFVFHQVPDSTSEVKRVDNSLIMMNGVQNSTYYNGDRHTFWVMETDSLSVLIRPSHHYYFEVSDLNIKGDKDYLVEIWFSVFEDILNGPEELRFVKPKLIDD